MISFSETFTRVRECFQDSSLGSLVAKLKSVTIIRDVEGKIRLFLELKQENKIESNEENHLSTLLSEKLEYYYGHDIWWQKGEGDAYKALIDLIIAERVQAPWFDESASLKWYILERHLAKQAWTENKIGQQLPWDFEKVEKGYKPAIVSFFSFKGGVGRTTTIAATALTLARNGHRVAIVDLDLEAPGLATIFSEDFADNSGVMDYLLEKKVQKDKWKLSLKDINDTNLLGDKGEILKLLPAGNVDQDYLEKLARLDFQNLVNGQLQGILKQMLEEIARLNGPLDFILMDARAGFHDIGGLAITYFSHAVVIFGTESRQSWAGLTQVIQHLALSNPEEPLPLILVHALAPSLGTVGREIELQKFREKAYTIFQEHYYTESEDVPNSNNTDAPFFPIVIPYDNSLRGDIALFTRDSRHDTPEEKERLANLVKVMTDSPYQTIAEKLCQLFERDVIINNR